MNADQAIQQLAAIIGTSTGMVVTEYARWHFVSAVGWLLCGIALAVYAARYYPKWNEEWDGDQKTAWYGCRILCIAIAAFFICTNLPDLFSPTAIGIHQLIKDIRA